MKACSGMFAAVVLALIVGAGPALAATHLLALQKGYGGRLFVEANVNGEGPFDFIVDTAASQTVIFQNLAKRISATPTGKPDPRVIGLGGVRTAPSFTISSLGLGDIEIRDAEVLVLPDWSGGERTPQGIIGLDVLDGRIAVFNHVGGELTLYDRDDLPPAALAGWRKAEFSRDTFGIVFSPLTVVNVTFRVGFSRRVVPFLIDSGADASVINTPAAGALRVIPTRARTRDEARSVSDTHGERIDGVIFYPPSIEIGQASWSDGSILVGDAPFFSEIGYGEAPFGVLGLDVLARAPFAIDLVRDDLYFGPVSE